jgi:hypothetical protein
MGIAILRTSCCFIFDFPDYKDYWFESVEWSEQTSSWQVVYKNNEKERLVLDSEPEYIPIFVGQCYNEIKDKYQIYQKSQKSTYDRIKERVEKDSSNRASSGGKSSSSNTTNTNTNTNTSRQSSDAVYNLNRD